MAFESRNAQAQIFILYINFKCPTSDNYEKCFKCDNLKRGCSSNGRAFASHAKGTGIDAPLLQIRWIL